VILLRKLTATTIILLILTSISLTYAIPSGGVYPPTFTKQTTFGYTEWYDSWGYNRNYYAGNDGFLPNLAYETIGSDKELAYNLGEQFKNEYPNKIRRAEEIFEYVQTWTDYGYDEDNVYMEGEPQPEWAWNADEMAHMIDQTIHTVAIGDCEDMTFLCSTLYLAAGFDVALVSPPEHVALMIWLPEYENANYYWDLEDDQRDYGWIWVEATSETNPLGWTPPDFVDGDFEVFLINYSTTIKVTYNPRYPEAQDQVTVTASVSLQNGTINQVQLHYSINSSSIRTINMNLQGSSYKANIPSQTDGTVIKFYVTAIDTEGNITESNEYSYTIGGEMFWMPDIPGFPIESIIIGLVIGLLVIYLLARKKQ
jgi:hypothetical protein